VFVEVLKQFLSGQILAAFHEAGDSGRIEIECTLDAALALKAEAYLPAAHVDAPVLHGG
jgi:hypothetical protein